MSLRQFTKVPTDIEAYVALVFLVGGGYFVITNGWHAMKIINEFDRRFEEKDKREKEEKEKKEKEEKEKKEKEEKEKKLAVA